MASFGDGQVSKIRTVAIVSTSELFTACCVDNVIYLAVLVPETLRCLKAANPGVDCSRTTKFIKLSSINEDGAVVIGDELVDVTLVVNRDVGGNRNIDQC